MDIDKYKIPAFRRKRSIQAKARKKILITALDRKEAGVSIVKPKIRRRRIVDRSRRQVGYTLSLADDKQEIMPMPIIDEGPAVCEIPAISDARRMILCGSCEGYFNKIEVAIVKLNRSLSIGDSVFFETSDGMFEQICEEMQINRKDVRTAFAGDDIGIKVKGEPCKGGKVWKSVNRL